MFNFKGNESSSPTDNAPSIKKIDNSHQGCLNYKPENEGEVNDVICTKSKPKQPK